MLMNECQFDLETVKAFCKIKASERQHFSVFLKTDRQRVEEHYAKRFMSRTDEAKMEFLEK